MIVVLSSSLTSPPALPADRDTYLLRLALVPGTAWKHDAEDHVGQFARWWRAGQEWRFFDPPWGCDCWDHDLLTHWIQDSPIAPWLWLPGGGGAVKVSDIDAEASLLGQTITSKGDGTAEWAFPRATTYGWWHLNEVVGITAADSSSNGRDGTLIGGASWVAGKINNCVSLVAASLQRVDCGAICSFERSQVWSAETWYYSNGASDAWIMGKNDAAASYRGWGIRHYSTGGELLVYLIDAYPGTCITIGFALPGTVAWHHVAITYDGSGMAAGVHGYIDDVLDPGRVVHSDTLGAGTIINAKTFTLGAESGDGALCLDGKIDEAVIYFGRVLTQPQVDFRWNGGVGTESMFDL